MKKYTIKRRPKFCEDCGTFVSQVGDKVVLSVKMLGRRRWKRLEFKQEELL